MIYDNKKGIFCSEIRFECIVVSTAPVKTAIDELLQNLFETLIWTLRHSINSQIQVCIF